MDDRRRQQPDGRGPEARRIARRILGVSEDASDADLKRAWRRACKEHHPDRNPDDTGANRKLAVINCAYRLLAKGEPCEMLGRQAGVQDGAMAEEGTGPGSAWSYFLWWRDRYFGGSEPGDTE
ncbi:MAG: DnaJ domain-containing protein [Candidatus Brocadiia bacterium]